MLGLSDPWEALRGSLLSEERNGASSEEAGSWSTWRRHLRQRRGDRKSRRWLCSREPGPLRVGPPLHGFQPLTFSCGRSGGSGAARRGYSSPMEDRAKGLPSPGSGSRDSWAVLWRE